MTDEKLAFEMQSKAAMVLKYCSLPRWLPVP